MKSVRKLNYIDLFLCYYADKLIIDDNLTFKIHFEDFDVEIKKTTPEIIIRNFKNSININKNQFFLTEMELEIFILYTSQIRIYEIAKCFSIEKRSIMKTINAMYKKLNIENKEPFSSKKLKALYFLTPLVGLNAINLPILNKYHLLDKSIERGEYSKNKALKFLE